MHYTGIDNTGVMSKPIEEIEESKRIISTFGHSGYSFAFVVDRSRGPRDYRAVLRHEGAIQRATRARS
ncbi:hypothetical protein [Edaphobacillus lindanitolerans]|uniref:Uncharacterized protein n=1 Tax=Edaphobacillus lindanitolerans TaxID=550447 RepID=A0A1U7PSQ6_9BACI|nr:hypothetical protein [Edaphobacillus lindanitolerans]SIT91559.1 hypothetical protein SAMN05428946_2703 [Edaphobacillus lindanitolerans]